MAGRDRQKQGLIYGPVRPSGPPDRGRIVGNMLGLLVVVVTAGVLGSAMAGSGSTVFALCETEADATRIAVAARERGWWSAATQTSPTGAVVSVQEALA